MSNATPAQAGLFNNRFVRVIILSGIFLQIGIWVRNFAILLFVMEKTANNPKAVSLISVIEFAPIFLFSFIGGTYADRWRPKRTMVWCDILSAISVFIVLLTIIFGRWEAVFFVTLISAILSQFSQPSAMKLFKTHIAGDKLQTIMAMYQTLMAVFMIIGPMLGTLTYQNFGITWAVGIMGVAFLFSAAVLAFLPPDKKEEVVQTEGNFLLEFKEGLRYMFARMEFSILGGVFFVAGLAVGIIQPLGVFIIVERLGLPKEYLQWLLAANGAAMLIGGGLIMGVARRVAPQKLLALGLLVNAIAILGIGLSNNWYLILAFQFFNGLFMPCIHIGINTLILQMTEEEFVGRVNGVLNPLFMGAMVITMSISGWLKGWFSLEILYGVSGALFLIGVMIVVPLFKINTARVKELKTADVE